MSNFVRLYLQTRNFVTIYLTVYYPGNFIQFLCPNQTSSRLLFVTAFDLKWFSKGTKIYHTGFCPDGASSSTILDFYKFLPNYMC